MNHSNPKIETQTLQKTITRFVSANPLLLAILVGALSLRIVFAIAVPAENNWSDSSGYHYIALNLVEGNGYSRDAGPPYQPTRIRPPAYPAFLAIVYAFFGPHPKAAVLLQTLLGTATVLFVYLLTKTIFDRRAGLLAAAMAATYPALIYYDTRILREGFTAALLTAVLLLAVRTNQTRWSTSRFFSAGVLLAILSMCRPETLLLTAPVFYLMVRPNRSFKKLLKPALLVALPLLLTWGPWTARNYITFGSISPTADGIGSVLWFGSRWAEIGGEDRSAADYRELREETIAIKHGPKEDGYEPTFLRQTAQDILNKPGWFAGLVFKKMYIFWKDANGVRKTLPAIHPALALLVNTYYYILLAFVLTGFLMARGQSWFRPLFATVLFYMCIYALLHVRNRYRVPVMPLVLVLSAGGFWLAWDFVRQRLFPKNTSNAISWKKEGTTNGVYVHPPVEKSSGEEL